MTTYQGDATRIYKAALTQVNVTEQELLTVYQAMKDSIELRIAKMNRSKAPVTTARLDAVLSDLNKEITVLKNQTQRIITSNYVKTYSNTYYATAYNYEKWANVSAAQLTTGRYELGFYRANRDYIVASLDRRVAGEGLRDRLGRQSAILQSELRQAIATAVTTGDTVKQTAKNIERGSKLLQDAASKAANHSATIARTELLKAYSIGDELATMQAEAAGVEVVPTWDASLDGKTRPAHGAADKKKFILSDGQWSLNVGGVRFSSPRIPLEGQTNTAGQIVNCRCRRLNNPFGFQPTRRAARRSDGTWEEVNGDVAYTEWAKGLDEGTDAKFRNARTLAERLREQRNNR